MPNGKPGDHPLTDIFAHNIEVYGSEADDLIRKIADLSIGSELHEWWEREIFSSEDRELVLRKAKARYQELVRNRPSQGSVEMLLAQLEKIPKGQDEGFELLVPWRLTLRGQPASRDVAMASVLNKVIGMAYEPCSFTETEGGRLYKFKLMP